jgi:hypothetical protein
MLRPFLVLVDEELDRAHINHPAGIHSAHEGYAVILEELDELKDEVWKKREHRDSEAILRELIQVAAMATRMAEDLGLIGDEP